MDGGIMGNKTYKDSFVKGSGLGSELENLKYKVNYDDMNKNQIYEQNENDFDEIQIEEMDMNDG